MPKFDPYANNTKLETPTLGEVELKYISSGDTHEYMKLMGNLKEINGQFELQSNSEVSNRDFVLKILNNQLLMPEISFDKLRKINEEEIKQIGKAFIENESSFFRFYENKWDFFKDFRAAVEKELERDIEPMKKTMIDVLKRAKAATENIQNILPKIHMPKIFDIEDRKIMSFKSPEIVREENNWERHTQLLEVQEGILKEQKNGQKKSTKLAWIVIIISFLALIISVVGVMYSIFSFEWLNDIVDKLFKK